MPYLLPVTVYGGFGHVPHFRYLFRPHAVADHITYGYFRGRHRVVFNR